MKSPRRISRRGFVKMTAGAVASSYAVGLTGCGTPARAQTPIGVQLYSVRHELAEDMEGTLDRLAEMGLEGVEFADYYGRSAAELRRLLDDRGLRCCGTHIYMTDMLGDMLPETVTFNETLGNEYLIVRWIPEEDRDSRESFMRTTERFNQIAEDLAPHGMRVGYHNHDYIFQTFDGEMLWDILAENTRDDVILQLDTGHAAGFGMDPVELLQRHPGRTATMHAKPHSRANPEAVIGEDELDWPRIKQVAESDGGIEWYILEYEVEGVDPLAALQSSLTNFNRSPH